MAKNPLVMLVILDGWGWREAAADNAVLQADTPTFDRLWSTCPHAFLRTSGREVGLPPGQMGNSEVGHLNIGAGRLVMQDLPRINEAIEDGSIATLPALVGLIDRLRQTGGTCHLMGLMSPGGVHSHQDHAVALANILADARVPTVVHPFTDGRDTPPRSGADDLERLQKQLPPSATIGTVFGRYYAMDRDNRWDRVAKAYTVICEGLGARYADARSVMSYAYAHDITDEFVVPAMVGRLPRHARWRRAALLQLPRRPRAPDSRIPARSGFLGLSAVAQGQVRGCRRHDAVQRGSRCPVRAIFPTQTLPNVLGEVVAKAGRTQLRMAETEKYPHVTYFLNGGREEPYPEEARIMVPSPKVATYDLQPEMSAPALTDKAVEAIRSGKYDLIVLNYANADMVGHTGGLPAAIKAVEAVDAGLGRLAEAVRRSAGPCWSRPITATAR